MANPGSFPPMGAPPMGPPMPPPMGAPPMGPGMGPGGPGMMPRPPQRQGTSRMVPVVVSAGLAVGVFCGLLFGLGTGKSAAAPPEKATNGVRRNDDTPTESVSNNPDKPIPKSGKVAPAACKHQQEDRYGEIGNADGQVGRRVSPDQPGAPEQAEPMRRKAVRSEQPGGKFLEHFAPARANAARLRQARARTAII